MVLSLPMRPRAVALVVGFSATGLALFGTDARAFDRPSAYSVRLEAGAEYDSNPTRRETVDGSSPPLPAAPSPALRLALSGDFDQRTTDRLSLSLGGGIAARRLTQPDAQGEDLLVADARASLGYLLGAAWSLSAGGSVYDVVQRADSIEEARDFRSFAPVLRLAGSLGPGRLQLGAGWRDFRFKPAPALDFHGPTASASYRITPVFALDGAAEWDYGLAASVEQRRFPLTPCSVDEGCPDATPVGRLDRFFTLDADVTRTGDALLGAGVSLQHNRSDRFGQSLWRGLGHLRLVCVLPWQLSLATRAELVVTRYADAVPIGHDANTGAFVTIEDEGRSSLRLDLSHPLGPHLEAGLRATVYAQAPGTGPVHFSRQLYFAYLAVTLGR